MDKSRELQMKSYTFKVILERDKWPGEPEEKAVWRAYISVLPAAHAWGDTQQEALENLKNAVDLIIDDMLERGEPIPEEPPSQVKTSKEPLITVTV
jgi:predicted RNase H-like HicB family nuclease